MAYTKDDRQLGKFRITALIIVAAVLLVLAVAVHGRTPMDTSAPIPETQSSGSTTSPDRVKSQAGANGDTAPSPTGTGPGSDNSLLGQ